MPRTVPMRPVRPNIGLEMELFRQLRALVEQMTGEIERKLNPPVTTLLASDASFSEIMNILSDLRNRWRSIWDAKARPITERALKEAYQQGDAAYQRALRQHGVSVKFTKTPAIEQVLDTQVRRGVELITNIPEFLFSHIERKARETVETGGIREFQTWLRDEVPGMSTRRARTVANHQTSMTNAQITATRTSELGLQSKWRHSRGAFKTKPRPTHVDMDGEIFDPAVGLYDEAVGEMIQPGQLIWCRCVAIPQLPTTLAR